MSCQARAEGIADQMQARQPDQNLRSDHDKMQARLRRHTKVLQWLPSKHAAQNCCADRYCGFPVEEECSNVDHGIGSARNFR